MHLKLRMDWRHTGLYVCRRFGTEHFVGQTSPLRSEEEFQTMTAHKELSAWLSSMELDVSDAGKLFYLIDRDKRGLAAYTKNGNVAGN